MPIMTRGITFLATQLIGGLHGMLGGLYSVVQPTILKQCGQQPPSSSTDQCLYLGLAGCGGPNISYAIYPISKEKLLKSSQRIPPIPVNIPSECLEMGCGNWGSKILFVGGLKPEKKEQLNDDTEGEYSKSVIVGLDTASSSGGPSRRPEVPSMQSGKASPLVLSVSDTAISDPSQQPQDSLYTLAGTPLYVVPNPTFEKYSYDNTTSTWMWSGLPSPPFLDPSCKYFQDPEYCAHVVIKHEIHVSTSSSSFTFDTKAEQWKPCTLFGDARPWTEDIQYPPPYEWMNYPAAADNKNNGGGIQSCGGGAPFNFDGGAVLYKVDDDDDFLICVVLSKGVVIAQKLVNNKVEHAEPLEGLEIPIHAMTACLADFGQGLLCLVVSSFDHNQAQKNSKSEISITPFQVSRNNTNRKLKCKVRKKFFLPSMKQSSPYQIWSAISCFVPKNSRYTTPTTAPII